MIRDQGAFECTPTLDAFAIGLETGNQRSVVSDWGVFGCTPMLDASAIGLEISSQWPVIRKTI